MSRVVTSRVLINVAIFLVGLVVGGYLFAASQPRSFLAVLDCRSSCYQQSDLAGLLASAGIQRAGALLAVVAKETDRCVAMRHPRPKADVHYVVFPKKDVRDISDVSVEDHPYVLDCLAVIRALVLEQGLRDYRVITNGPGLQHVTYLHFHLIAGQRGAQRRAPRDASQAAPPERGR